MAPKNSRLYPTALVLRVLACMFAGSGGSTVTELPDSTQTANPSSTITPGPGIQALSTALALRGENIAPQQYCGWISGEDGGDVAAPLKCAETQSFCALIQPNVIGCCDPEEEEVGNAACEWYTTCYASSEVKYLTSEDARAQLCTYTASYTLQTITSSFDRARPSYDTFSTLLVITTTESECVLWRFQIGSRTATTWGCDTTAETLDVVTNIATGALTAVLSTLSEAIPTLPSSTTVALPSSTTTVASSPPPHSSPASSGSNSKKVYIIVGSVTGVVAVVGVLFGIAICRGKISLSWTHPHRERKSHLITSTHTANSTVASSVQTLAAVPTRYDDGASFCLSSLRSEPGSIYNLGRVLEGPPPQGFAPQRFVDPDEQRSVGPDVGANSPSLLHSSATVPSYL